MFGVPEGEEVRREMVDSCKGEEDMSGGTAWRVRLLRMDHKCIPMGERALEEGGPSRTDSADADILRRRLGLSPMLWDHLCSEERPHEKAN